MKCFSKKIFKKENKDFMFEIEGVKINNKILIFLDCYFKNKINKKNRNECIMEYIDIEKSLINNNIKYIYCFQNSNNKKGIKFLQIFGTWKYIITVENNNNKYHLYKKKLEI